MPEYPDFALDVLKKQIKTIDKLMDKYKKEQVYTYMELSKHLCSLMDNYWDFYNYWSKEKK